MDMYSPLKLTSLKSPKSHAGHSCVSLNQLKSALKTVEEKVWKVIQDVIC